MNETWICDAGRFGYKSINENRVITSARYSKTGRLQQVSWQVALEHAVEALQRHGGAAVGIIVAPRGPTKIVICSPGSHLKCSPLSTLSCILASLETRMTF